MIEFLIRGWDLETVGRDRDNCGGEEVRGEGLTTAEGRPRHVRGP